MDPNLKRIVDEAEVPVEVQEAMLESGFKTVSGFVRGAPGDTELNELIDELEQATRHLEWRWRLQGKSLGRPTH